MRDICEDIKAHVTEVVTEWERLVRTQPWYSLPRVHRLDDLPEVILGLVDASLCDPGDPEAHRRNVEAGCTHGNHRRAQGIPEHLILTEFHLLRQALWNYLIGRFGASTRVAGAIMRIDTVITVATNASMWGYFREEVEAQGRWEELLQRMISSSPMLRDIGGP